MLLLCCSPAGSRVLDVFLCLLALQICKCSAFPPGLSHQSLLSPLRCWCCYCAAFPPGLGFSMCSFACWRCKCNAFPPGLGHESLLSPFDSWCYYATSLLLCCFPARTGVLDVFLCSYACWRCECSAFPLGLGHQSLLSPFICWCYSLLPCCFPARTGVLDAFLCLLALQMQCFPAGT